MRLSILFGLFMKYIISTNKSRNSGFPWESQLQYEEEDK